MDWVKHTIWWHVYPLGFVGAPIRDADPETEGPHRLRHLLNWLDYAVELGVSGLLLGPIFTSSTHGYDSTDQFEIDPRLGSEEDFIELVEECHQRGLRVLLDGVFSHVGSAHPDVVDVLQQGRLAPKAELFDIDWDHEGGPQPRVFEGHGTLVRLNHASATTAKYVADVMDYWLGLGADGWRLDAAYSVSPWFWRKVLPDVRKNHPEAWFLGEVIHGDYIEFVDESTMDSVTQYELWKAIWSSLLDSNFFELDWSLRRHNEFLDHFLPNTFVGNHDVTRIATTLGPNRALLAFVVLMTVGGVPSVYYGDEQGFTGLKEEAVGGDDAVRPAMPTTPAELLPMGANLFTAHRELIGLRRRNAWLVSAKTEPVTVAHTNYVYRTTSANGSEFIETEIDLDSGRATIRDEAGTILWAGPDLE